MSQLATKPPSAHAELVRSRLLEAAARAFARSGFEGTSVPDIAAEARVSVGLIYRYFESKAELFRAIWISRTEQEMEALHGEIASIADPRERLERGVEYYLRMLVAEPGAGLLLSAFAEAAADPAVRELVGLRRRFVRDFVERYLEEGIEAGELDPLVPARDFAEAITLLIDGAVVAWAAEGAGLDLGELRRAVVSLLSAALRRAA